MTTSVAEAQVFLTEKMNDVRFRQELAELQAHGLIVKAGVSSDNRVWNYTAHELLDQMETCCYYLAAYVFEYEKSNTPTLREGAYGPYITIYSFSNFAQELAMAFEALYEIPDSRMKRAVRTNLWMQAVLLYEYAGDRENVQRMGYRRGENNQLYEGPISILKIVHQMCFDDNDDYVVELAWEAEPEDHDNVMPDAKGLYQLAVAAEAMTIYKSMFNLKDGVKAVLASNLAHIFYIEDLDNLFEDESALAFSMAAAFWLNILRTHEVRCRRSEDESLSEEDCGLCEDYEYVLESVRV